MTSLGLAYGTVDLCVARTAIYILLLFGSATSGTMPSYDSRCDPRLRGRHGDGSDECAEVPTLRVLDSLCGGCLCLTGT